MNHLKGKPVQLAKPKDAAAPATPAEGGAAKTP
jgi:hypothetical protein